MVWAAVGFGAVVLAVRGARGVPGGVCAGGGRLAGESADPQAHPGGDRRRKHGGAGAGARVAGDPGRKPGARGGHPAAFRRVRRRGPGVRAGEAAGRHGGGGGGRDPIEGAAGVHPAEEDFAGKELRVKNDMNTLVRLEAELTC